MTNEYGDTRLLNNSTIQSEGEYSSISALNESPHIHCLLKPPRSGGSGGGVQQPLLNFTSEAYPL